MDGRGIIQLSYSKFNSRFLYLVLYLSMFFTLSSSWCWVWNCQACTGNAWVCATCDPRFYLKADGQCSSCNVIPSCKLCTSSTVCTECIDDTFVLNSNSKCQLCSLLINGCKNCVSQTQCGACIDDTYLLTSTSQCQICSSLITNCLICSSDTQCATCINNTYILTSTSQCQLCSSLMTDCLICSSDTQCAACINDTYILTSTYQCQLCSSLMADCLKCSSDTQCTACINDTYVISSPSVCQLCSSLMTDCLKCSSDTQCTTCINNTYVISSPSVCQLCSQLMDNCSICASPTVCSNCSSNSLVVSTTTFLCVTCDTFLAFCTNCTSTTVCIACLPIPGIFLDSTLQICQICYINMPHCMTCSSATTCLTCSPLYTVIPGVNCVLCVSLMFGCLNCSDTTTCNVCSTGLVVTGGCSKVIGCIQVTQIASPVSSPCIRCKSQQFYPIPSNGTCKCLRGYLAGTYCTTLLGCTNVIKNSSGEFCLTCNLMQNFILSSPICVCKKGYSLNGLTCSQICGDGMVFTYKCDDGNNIDGDGCSSTCQNEKNYKCVGSKTTPSHCRFIGFVSLKVTSVDKVVDENKIMITITTSPTINNLQLMNITNLYNFNSSGDCSLVSITVVGPSIQLLVHYNSDLVGSSANFQLSFDNYTITSPPFNCQFLIENSLAKVFYYIPQSSSTKIIKFGVLILSLAALLVFFIGSYSHKMIGVQTIHSFQLIFIMQTFSIRYNALMSTFHYLSLTLGNSNFMLTPNDYIAQEYYNNLKFMQDIIYNIYLLVIIQLSIVAVYIFIFFTHKKIVDQTYQVYSWKHKYKAFIIKLRAIYYDFFLFPIFIGFFYLICLSFGTFCRTDVLKSCKPILIESIAVFFMFLFTSFMFFNEWKFFFFEKEEKLKGQKKCKQYYTPIYLTYLILLSLVFQLELFKMIQLPIYVCGGIIVVYTMFFILYRPYKSWVHNVGIIINQIGILLCIAWLVLQKILPIIKSYQSIIAYCQIGWLSLILFWAVIRIIYQIRLSISQLQSKKKKKSNKKIQKDQEYYSNQLKKAILQQESKMINPYRIIAQKIRIQEADNNYINTIRRQSDLQEFNFKDKYMQLAQTISKPLGHKIKIQKEKYSPQNISQLYGKINVDNQKKNEKVYSFID